MDKKFQPKIDAFENSENMAFELPVGRQIGAQSPQRRDPGTPNGDQSPPFEPPDLALGFPKVTPESHFGGDFNLFSIFGTRGLDFGSPGVAAGSILGSPGYHFYFVEPKS